MSVIGTNEKVHLAQIAPSEFKRLTVLDDLTNICIEQLALEENLEETKSLKRTALSDIENNTNNKVRKLEKCIISHKSGSFTEFTVDENNIPNGKAFYSGHNGLLMDFNLKNGIKHGSATLYYPDGAIETREYNFGIKEGYTTYKHNYIESTGHLVNGQLEGKVTRKSLISNTISEAAYKNGQPTGVEKITYSNGEVLTRNTNSTYCTSRK